MKLGAWIRIGHSAEGMEGATVVYSTDIAENNVEMMYAKKSNLQILKKSPGLKERDLDGEGAGELQALFGLNFAA